MVRGGKSIGQIQDAILGQFKRDMMQQPSTFINEQIAISKAAAQAFEQKKDDRPHAHKMFDAKVRFELRKQEEEMKLQRIVQDNSKYHSFLQRFYDAFGSQIYFTKNELESVVDELEDIELAENCILKSAKCNKKSAQFKMSIYGEDLKIKVLYGNAIAFRQNATPQLLEIVRTHNIPNDNQLISEETKTHSWTFNEF